LAAASPVIGPHRTPGAAKPALAALAALSAADHLLNLLPELTASRRARKRPARGAPFSERPRARAL
jgi:hypothetical protein